KADTIFVSCKRRRDVMPTLGNVELERIVEKVRRKARLVVEKPVVGKDIPYRGSVSGRGLEWEIRGILAGESDEELYAKEQALQALADGEAKNFDEYDDPSKDAYTVLVGDVEINRLAGQLYRSGYTLRLLLKAIQYARLAKTYPAITQQAQALLSYCYKVQPSTLPNVAQALQYVLGVSAQAQTLPTVSQTASYELTLVYALSRTTYGKILYDNFDDNSLDPAWTYEEGVSGNSITEQNQRLEFIGAQNSYRHVQRTFGGINNPVLVARMNQASSSPTEATWGVGLGIWFNQYDHAKICIDTSTSHSFGVIWDKNGTKTSNWLGTSAANTWYYLKIIVTSDTVYFYKSDDGQTWTQLTSTSRASTWTIDTNSLVILGHGYEESSSSYPNPDFDNNYSSTGSDVTSYIDDFIMVRSETITVNGLSDGWYFKVRKGSNYHQSSAASNGTATLNCSSIITQAPFDELEVYNASNELILDNQFPDDVWPGDVYIFS
ncbi:MAG: hypothetical protein QXE79_03290, partial [Candidatus Bathyarchaeia archaeon]